MDRTEYKRLYNKIDAKFEERLKAALDKVRADLDAERRRDIEGLSRTWCLDNDEPPPHISASTSTHSHSTKAKSKPTKGGNKPNSENFHSRNDKIRYAVRLLDGDEVTQPKVMAKFQEMFPREAKGLYGTTISKVLRGMEKDGLLIKVSAATAHNPTTYKKV